MSMASALAEKTENGCSMRLEIASFNSYISQKRLEKMKGSNPKMYGIAKQKKVKK